MPEFDHPRRAENTAPQPLNPAGKAVACLHSGLAQNGITTFDIRPCKLRAEVSQATDILDLARRLDVSGLLLIVNMAAASFDRAEVRAKLAETYGCEVAGVLPYADQVKACEEAGLFVLDYPARQLTAELCRISDQR